MPLSAAPAPPDPARLMLSRALRWAALCVGLLAASAQAQPAPGGAAPQEPVAVPIDGGLALLALAGAGLAAHRLRRRRA